jgi:hypothetical protein
MQAPSSTGSQTVQDIMAPFVIYSEKLTAAQILSLFTTRNLAIWVNCGIRLPDYVLDEVMKTGPKNDTVSLEIKVNTSFDSRVRVYKIHNKILFATKSFTHLLLDRSRDLYHAMQKPFIKQEASGSQLAEPEPVSSTLDKSDTRSQDSHLRRTIKQRVYAGLAKTKAMVRNIYMWSSNQLGVAVPAGPKLSSFVLVNSIQDIRPLPFHHRFTLH